MGGAQVTRLMLCLDATIRSDWRPRQLAIYGLHCLQSNIDADLHGYTAEAVYPRDFQLHYFYSVTNSPACGIDTLLQPS